MRILLFFWILSFKILASSVSVDIIPQNPVLNENFSVKFKIESDSDSAPDISFNPRNLEVLGRSDEGVVVQTTIINGRFTTKREAIYSYEVVANKAGRAGLRDIKVVIGQEVIKHKNISVKILSKRQRPQNIFLLAEVSKNEVFIGEGIDLRYYLYTKVGVLGHEIKKFPVLEKFLKRYHTKIDERLQTVNYKGEIYKRTLKYSARIYPEKIGKVKIDPLILRVQYQSGRKRSSFGGFSFGLQQAKVKTVRSDIVEVKVNALPAENVPSSFTGLVGKHDFSFSLPKNKFLVNEAVEARLEVKGGGALEKMTAPTIFNDEAFEAFDTKTEVIETGSSSAKKIFDFTYLTRKAVKKEESVVGLSYFDPVSLKYEEVNIKIPPIIIGGGQVKSSSYEKNESIASQKETIKRHDYKRSLVAPIFTKRFKSLQGHSWMKLVSILLGIILVMQIFYYLMKALILSKSSTSYSAQLFKEIKKEGLTFSKVFLILNQISDDSRGIREKIKSSDLSDKTKSYFLELIEKIEISNFADSKDRAKIHLRSNCFKELIRYVEDGSR